MSNSNSEKFLADLRDSEVVPLPDLEAFLQTQPSREPRALALALVQTGLLTDWQAKYILSGRRRLRLGSYLLQERIQRDELGDCFLAWHEPLHRQVKLLVLAEAMVRDQGQAAAVSEAISCLTSLDHPRLEHVYDVGEENGRLFVVFERAQGRNVDFRELGMLTQGEAAGLLQGVTAGLASLQSCQMAHGELAAAALQLDESGDGKIVGLCEAVLRRALEGTEALRSVSALQLDRRQWQELGARVISRHFRGPEFGRWQEWLTESIDNPEALDRLAAAVSVWRQEMTMAGEPSDLALGKELRPSEIAEQKSTVVSPPGRSSERPGRRKNSAESSATKKRVGNEGLKSGWGTRYQQLIAALLVVVGLGWIGWKIWPTGPERKATAARVGSSSNVEGRRSSAAVKQVTATTRRRPASSKEASGEAAIEPESGGATPQLSADRPTKVRADELPPLNPADAQSLHAANLESAPEVDEPLEKLPVSGGASELPPALAREEAVPQQAKRKTGEATEGAEVGGAAGPVSSEAQSSSTAEFPKLVNLGEPGAIADQTLGPLPNRNFDELKLELLFDPETVFRTRLYFELAPVGERSVWQVFGKKRTDDNDPQLVGEFKLVDGELRFGWASEVDARSPWVSLRNCFLKLEVAGETPMVTGLREPVLIEGLKLDPKTLAAETRLDLSGLPNFDSLRISWGPFGEEGVWAESQVLNDRFEARQPAVVVFRPDWNEQIFGLALERRLRGQLELSLAWVMQTPDKWLPVRQADLKTVVDATAEAYAQSVQAAELANRLAEDAPYGSKTKMRDQASQAKNRVAELKKRNDLVIAHQDKLTEIFASEPPIRIVYPLGERELILAETAMARAIAAQAEAGVEPESSKQPENQKGEE